LGLNVSVSNSC